MKTFNYYFPKPRLKLIKAIRVACQEGSAKYSILNNVFVSTEKPSPQSKQFNKTISVSNTGFSSLENNTLREYGFSVYVTSNNFDDFEELCEIFDGLLTTIKGDGIKWVEVESTLDDVDEDNSSFTRMFNLNVLIGAENFSLFL